MEEAKPSDDFKSSGINGKMCCPDVIVTDSETEGFLEKCSSPSKMYSSLMKYCHKAADELPQRQTFYAVDLEDVLWKIQEWKTRLPNFELFYSVKTNSDPILLQMLAALGLSFDCATKGELEMALEAGASPSNIIFGNTIKSVDELKYASDRGVNLVTFDNEAELRKIHSVHPNAKILVRIIAHSDNCLVYEDGKFGCTEDEAIGLLKIAKQLNLNVIGVSFHVGILCTDPTAYTRTIRTSRRIFEKAIEVGYSLSIVDVGGGFVGEAGSEESFHKMADSIKEATRENFPDGKVKIIGEPGTYVVGSAFKLVTTVLGRRCRDKAGEDQLRRYYYLNDGVFGAFFRIFKKYGAYPKPLLTEWEIRSRTRLESRLYGQTCCWIDLIEDRILLPDLEIGDRILWENMGAYCRSVSSSFNGIPLSVSRYVFIEKRRLHADWICDKRTSIENFLKRHVVAWISCDEHFGEWHKNI